MFYTPTKDMFTRSVVDTKKQTGKKTTLSNIEITWLYLIIEAVLFKLINN